jgi:prepilin-type N-terminal cleavage/methylation domain-containing protein
MDRYFLRQRGFTLVELSIVMAAVALLSTAVLPIAVRSMEIKAGEKTITEVGIIQDAAKKFYFDKKAWPTDLGQMKTEGYLSPSWSLLNPWNNPYQSITTAQTFGVSTTVPVNMVEMLKFRLPQSSASGQTVSSVIGGTGANLIAAGVIVAWAGAVIDIPAGWALCDGTNGTPDLRDKFIVGARQDEAGVSKTNITGVLTQFGGTIAHNHGGVTGDHTLTIAEMPKHHHGYMATPWTGSRYDGRSSPLMTQQVQGNTDDTGGDKPHSHTLSNDMHLPPYYALAFIMRLP